MQKANPDPNSMLANYGLTDTEWVAESLSKLGQAKDQAHVDFIARQINLKDKTGFDFGCGHGRTANALRDLGADMWGCEISPSILKNPDAQLKLGSIEVLREVRPRLDFIICISVLQLMDEDERKEFYRVCAARLSPGGSLIIVNGNPRTNISRKAVNLPDADRYSVPGFERQYLEYTKMPEWVGLRVLRRWNATAVRYTAKNLFRAEIDWPAIAKFHFDRQKIENNSTDWQKDNCQILMFHFRRK